MPAQTPGEIAARCRDIRRRLAILSADMECLSAAARRTARRDCDEDLERAADDLDAADKGVGRACLELAEAEMVLLGKCRVARRGVAA